MNAPDTTTAIVVIGRNEGKRLVDCLRSLQSSKNPIVYVDSASSDGSQAAALAAGAIVIDLDLSQPFTAARARHEGVKALLSRYATVSYIQFIDGDCTIAPGWIEKAEAFLDHNPQYAVVCGRRLERHPEASLYNRLADLEWDTPIGDVAACGGDCLMRMDAYCQVGGFDRHLIAGEEPELCSRLSLAGWKIYRTDADMTHHDAAMTRLIQYWRRAIRSGYGYAQAWHTTRKRPHPLYQRELLRTLFWGMIPPIVFVMGVIAKNPLLCLFPPVLYLAQMIRMAVRDGITSRFSWQRSGLLMISKVAETWGVLRYLWQRSTRVAGGTIVYK